jgi:kynureninase
VIDPRALRPHYTRFLREGRVLCTGHSHQAWPDAAREGLLESFDDAAALVDDKWERAMAARIGASADEIALGSSTHELVTRFLSALDLRARPRVVTTSGEFHSMHRQLKRLSEVGLEVVFVEAAPVETLAARMIDEVRAKPTAAVLVSSVLFETSTIVPDLIHVARAARACGTEMLVDAYHAFGVVPFTVDDLERSSFVTAGGYKYAQWGEGCCFLRVPRESALAPVYT